MDQTLNPPRPQAALRSLQSTALHSKAEGGRREAIDVARCLALLAVVFGHLTMAVVDRHGGTVRGANLLALKPGWSWVAVAAPMPIFFAAAGWANAQTTRSGAASRLRTLVGLATVVVAVWSVPVIVATLVTGEPGVLGSGARLATQPLWFLAAYLPLAAWGGTLGRLAARRPITVIGACLGALVALDVIRFELGGTAWFGWFGFLLAWSVPWLAGAWWRARHEAGAFPEGRVGFALLAGFGAVGGALVTFGGYQASLIDAVPGGRSNTSPPTVYTAVIAIAQVGALMLAARSLDRLGRRTRRLWDRLGATSVGVYLWHLSALALGAGLVALGLPAPERLTPSWWLTRPLWFAVVLGITTMLVAITDMLRKRFGSFAPGSASEGEPRGAWLGTSVAAVAAGAVGLKGPSDLQWATVCTLLFAAAWWLMRPRDPSRPPLTTRRSATVQEAVAHRSIGHATGWNRTPR